MVTHGRGSEGETMEWVGVPFTLPRNMVYPALIPLMRTPRLPVIDWTDAPADLNGLVLFAERRNLVSARVPAHFTPSLSGTYLLAPKSLDSRAHIDFYFKISGFFVVSERVFIEAWSLPSLSVFLRFYSTTLWCSALDKRQLFSDFTLVHA